MKYFSYLKQDQIRSIFYKEPERFSRNDSKEKLAYALGSTLYMPATREHIIEDILKNMKKGLMTIVLCLEDAIGDNQVKAAEQNLIQNMEKLNCLIEDNQISYDDIPLLFIRIRNAEQMSRLASALSDKLNLITGFVFPKFSYDKGEEYFKELERINKETDNIIYGMPILESKEIIYSESRKAELYKLAQIFDKYNELVLNVRIGATDFCSLFGIRRSYSASIYDIQVIRDCIGDIVNVLCRVDRNFVVSAPVWEYFSSGDRLLKPLLRSTPFTKKFGEKMGTEMRAQLLNQYLDGLLREIELDKANGLCGKTIIHPSHIVPVQSMYVVTHEEYTDALGIMKNQNGDIGVFKSEYSNKMNEIKPHINWARKVLSRAEIYGVFNKEMKYLDLLYYSV
ncbi:HpcH/HpaI aldolase/citrate lyase family protein [Abyssisolibacter fermentans]|uniref:HpcH/HpaI aldolase/citrate lyase family protein n=1 Tax=Abyssisolibacter fermentans TaxID=1766203 RepID=UPI000835AD89|nr:HpcH/HpaI aldolase/citrate lyase family protein [Abyssisolibacter fermentans]